MAGLIPWNRYAMIAELAKRLDGHSPQFGKTVLQKLMYLLQQLYHIDCGYDFELYTYGPFTSQLLQDLDLVEGIEGVKLNSVPGIPGACDIKPSSRTDSLILKAREFLTERRVEDALSKLVDEFGACSAKELELYSTVVFVERDLKRGKQELSKDIVVDVVQQLKPKFSDSMIVGAVDVLQSNGHIQMLT